MRKSAGLICLNSTLILGKVLGAPIILNEKDNAEGRFVKRGWNILLCLENKNTARC